MKVLLNNKNLISIGKMEMIFQTKKTLPFFHIMKHISLSTFDNIFAKPFLWIIYI